ncbi:MAG: nodulation protein NfeD [Dehalococcoidia bacterium]|nr:nodulation protein NfeD [Dehalococcoidia bacterium]
MRKALALAVLAIWVLFLASSVAVSAAAPQVDVITVKGVISPILSGYIAKSIRTAEADGAVALVMEIDTPGGLDTSMREIIQNILNSRVPVVAYVWPQGSRDASAGVYITMASHVAAMAPSTNIGAAHPVALGGSPTGGTQTQPADTETTKITNDAVAYIRGLAEQRGRNTDWAEQAVRESVSITAAEARNLHVIDFVAADLPDLLRQMDGMTLSLQGGPVTLHSAGASIHQMDMGAIEQFLLNISDPNIAFLLLSLSVTALFIEFTNPGLILPGIIGGISLLLALFSLGELPVNYAGVGLILLAFVLFVLEIKIVSYGMLTIGGVASMVLGGLLLVNSASVDLQVSRTLIAFVALATAAAFFFVVRAVRRAQRRKPTTGREGLIGETAVTRSGLDPDGFVFLEGERWAAVSESGAIAAGEQVEVVAKDGFRLRVRKKDA